MNRLQPTGDGRNLYKYIWDEKIKRSWKLAFLSALIIGLLVHIYKFTNTLPNHDSFCHVWGTNNSLPSGRWLLEIVSTPSSYFDLPWVTGLLSLVFIGLTAAVVVDIFDIKDGTTIVLSSGLLVSFPCVASLFFYQYTADAYMQAMLLAALTVRFAMIGDRDPRHTVLALICFCCSCGIYQTYASFALLLSLSHLIWELLKNERDNREYLRWIGKQFIVYLGGLLLYMAIWKLLMALQSKLAYEYQGIAEASLLKLSELPAAVKDALKIFVRFFLNWDVTEYGWTVYAAMNLVFLAATGAILIYAVIKTGLYKRWLHVLLLLLSLAATPFFVAIWRFTSSDVTYYHMMLQSISVIYIFSVFLFFKYCPKRVWNAAILFFALIVFKFGVQANQCYFEMDKTYLKTVQIGNEMAERLHIMDDGSFDKVAVIGYKDSSVAGYEPERVGEIYEYMHMLKLDLVYTNANVEHYFKEFLRENYEFASQDEVMALYETDEFKDMSLWPAADSLRIIDGYAVIKLTDALWWY